MSFKSEAYCRLCAESKYEMFDLSMDDEKYMDILKKLSYMSAVYVDLSDDIIPKTICFLCCKSLQNAYDFLNRVQKAQSILKEYMTSKKNYNSAYLNAINQPTDPPTIHVKFESLDIENVKKEPKDIFDGNQNTKLNVQNNSGSHLFDKAITTTSTIESTKQSLYQSANVPIVGNLVSIVPIAGASPREETRQLSNVITWKNYSWLCSDCKMKFSDASKLRIHIKEEHKKCFAFACGDCNTIPNDFEEFLAHARTHRRYLRFCCPYCDAVTKSSISYTKHLSSEHFEHSEHLCKPCGELFSDADSFNKHTSQYSTPTVSKSTVERVRNHTCDRCGKAFYKKEALINHIKLHDEIRPHVCKICNKAFTLLHFLREHVRSHTSIKPFTCDQCHKTFRLERQLRRHSIVHTDSMPYKCKYCDKRFRFKQPMDSHELQHTGLKPHKCKFCPMEFTGWTNCNKHMKRMHGTDTAKKKRTPDGVIPVDPKTGQLMKMPDSAEIEEWKNRILLTRKRGKQK